MYKALSGGYTIISHQRNPSLDAATNDKFNTYPPLEGSRAYRVGPGLFRFRSCRFPACFLLSGCGIYYFVILCKKSRQKTEVRYGFQSGILQNILLCS